MSEFYVNRAKVKFRGCIQSFMLPWKLRKRQILYVNQNLSSVISIFFTCQVSACELQPFSCHDLAMTYTHKLPKLCKATLRPRLEIANWFASGQLELIIMLSLI